MESRVGRPSEKRLVSASRISFRRPPDGCVPLKICTKCKIEKCLYEFNKHNGCSDGLRPDCKSCVKESNARYRDENKEKIAKSKAEYQKQNREKLRIYEAAWRAKNPEKAAAPKVRWSQKNRESEAARLALWRRNNPEAKKANNHARRALSAGASGSHTRSDIVNLLNLQKHRCASCKLKVLKSGKLVYHVDHIMPLSKGGSNSPDNLQILCPACNLRKHAKHPLAWAKENHRLL